MNRIIRWYDYITVNIYWMGLTSIAQTMTPLVVPLLVQQFVGEEAKGTFFGTLRLWTLMVALLVQSLMGMVSDRSTSKFGRRRPFIFIGTIGLLIIMALIGVSTNLEGMAGYWVLFGLVVLLAIASNTAHAAQQGLIPDVIPDHLRGRFSGIKAVLEIPVPMILIAFTVGRLISSGNMWAGIAVTMAVVTIAMLMTMFVPESQITTSSQKFDWKPFSRLVLMTATFTIVILAMGQLVKLTGGLVHGFGSTLGLILVMGGIGLGSILFAVGMGVWASIRIGLGGESRANPSFTWWVINRLAFLVGVNNLAGFTIYFLQARLGYVREEAAGPAAFLTMFVGVFILLSALPSGWLADRFGRKNLVAFSGIIASLGTLVAILSPSLPFIYIGGCIIGIATGLFFAANWALGTNLVPKEQAGRYLGISNLAGAGAGAVGGYIGGPIADQISNQIPAMPGIGYVLLFAIFGIMFMLSIVALLGVKDHGIHFVRDTAKLETS
jgi:MFS family permease